jgi:hypothetical protein
MKLQPKPQNGKLKIIMTLAREFGTWNIRAVLRPVSIKELILQIKQYSIHVNGHTGYQMARGGNN